MQHYTEAEVQPLGPWLVVPEWVVELPAGQDILDAIFDLASCETVEEIQMKKRRAMAMARAIFKRSMVHLADYMIRALDRMLVSRAQYLWGGFIILVQLVRDKQLVEILTPCLSHWHRWLIINWLPVRVEQFFAGRDDPFVVQGVRKQQVSTFLSDVATWMRLMPTGTVATDASGADGAGAGAGAGASAEASGRVRR